MNKRRTRLRHHIADVSQAKEQERERVERLHLLKRILIEHPEGLRVSDLALLMRIHRSVVYRLLQLIDYYEVSYGRYSAHPTEAEIFYAHVVLKWERQQKRHR